VAQSVQGLAQTDCGGGLAFAGWCRIDRRHQDESAIRPIGQPFIQGVIKLGLVTAVQVQLIFGDAQVTGNVQDWAHHFLARNFDIRQHLFPPCSRNSNFPLSAQYFG